MNSIFQYGGVQANPLYNCSSKTSEEWTEQLGTKRPLLGVVVMLFGIFIEIIYVPCLCAIYKRRLLQHSCYKIMFLLGVTDMIATCGWVCSCALTLMLIINRISDILVPHISAIVFSRSYSWIVILIPIVYTIAVIFFTPAILFNSTVMAWIGDPRIHDNMSGYYYNPIQNCNNVVFITGTIFFYGAYCFFMRKKQRGFKVFIQSTLICSINCSSALVYSMMMFVTPNEYIVLFGELAWSLVHGCPAIIYLTMNQTIRQEVLSWFRKKSAVVQRSDLLSSQLQSRAINNNAR
uniref:Serpentine receptor class gamma n=1 Tax=Caenorhabditis japonica TaxID=281687 RepID=A0A8R1DPD1_CAEJA